MIDWNPDPQSVCRDERCDIEGVHPKHLIRKIKPKPHHRPRERWAATMAAAMQIPSWWAWTAGLAMAIQQDQTKPSALLQECIERAIGVVPMTVLEIQRDVKDDFGDTCERTIYRHIKNLVAMGRLVKLDVGLTFAAYVKPGSRMARDRGVVREYLLSNIEGGVRQFNGSHAW